MGMTCGFHPLQVHRPSTTIYRPSDRVQEKWEIMRKFLAILSGLESDDYSKINKVVTLVISNV